MDKIKNFIDKNVDSDQQVLLIAAIICGVLQFYCHSAISKFIAESVSAETLSLQGMAFFAGGFLAEISWKTGLNRWVKKAFIILMIIESILFFTAAGYVAFISRNAYIMIVGEVLTNVVIGCYTSLATREFKNTLWQGKKRSQFDNNNGIITKAVGITGLLIATVKAPEIEIALIIWAISGIFSGLGWMIVYYRHRKELLQEDDKKED